ncbi:MAG TPA: DNA/RNA helicase domain-containing protein, partial [Opitutaceae bacterium]
MLLKLAEFRSRIECDIDRLILDLKQSTQRFGFEEEQSWRTSLPKVSRAFSDKSFENLDLFFGSNGNLALEYRMPGGGGWADLVLLGQHRKKPSAVVVELKDWITRGDVPGCGEGLMERHGRSEGHPSDQVRGYVEWCQNYHSVVHDRAASLHGCVIFTRDPYYQAYGLPPNDGLTRSYPCFSTDQHDVATRLPEFFKTRLSEPDRDFAEAFEKGFYKQSRGLIRQIGEQILNPKRSPFVLIENQRLAFALVKARVTSAVAHRKLRKTVILIEGPPGSGKSAVAANVWASLSVDPRVPEGNIVVATTSASQSSNWRFLFSRAADAGGGAGVVAAATGYTPIHTTQFGSLRERFPTAFKKEVHWRDNLRMLRSLAPEFRSGSKDDEFLVSIVDEAHALINPEHVEGVGQHGFATAFGPQAYHIMRSSVISVFLMDVRQGFRDQENTTILDLKRWAGELGVEVFEEVNLAGNQFRCAGSKEYTDWVEAFLGLSLEEPNTAKPKEPSIGTGSAAYQGAAILAAEAPQAAYSGRDGRKISRLFPLEIKLFGDPAQLEAGLREQIAKGNTARLLASYGRKWRTKGVALPHDIPGHLKDFDEPYTVDGEARR